MDEVFTIFRCFKVLSCKLHRIQFSTSNRRDRNFNLFSRAVVDPLKLETLGNFPYISQKILQLTLAFIETSIHIRYFTFHDEIPAILKQFHVLKKTHSENQFVKNVGFYRMFFTLIRYQND